MRSPCRWRPGRHTDNFNRCLEAKYGETKKIGVFFMITSPPVTDLDSTHRLFYGCSYRFHLSGDNSRDRYIKGSCTCRI